jgi:hypothetical protein
MGDFGGLHIGEQFPLPLGPRTTPWACRVCRSCCKRGSPGGLWPELGLPGTGWGIGPRRLVVDEGGGL